MGARCTSLRMVVPWIEYASLRVFGFDRHHSGMIGQLRQAGNVRLDTAALTRMDADRCEYLRMGFRQTANHGKVFQTDPDAQYRIHAGIPSLVQNGVERPAQLDEIQTVQMAMGIDERHTKRQPEGTDERFGYGTDDAAIAYIVCVIRSDFKVPPR